MRTDSASWRAAAVRHSETIINYLRSHQLMSVELVAALEDVLRDLRSGRDDRGFEELLDNLQHMHRSMPEAHFVALGDLLNAQDAAVLRSKSKSQNRLLSKVLLRRSIVTEDEYRVILDRVDELAQADQSNDELESLNRMLLEFDRRSTGE